MKRHILELCYHTIWSLMIIEGFVFYCCYFFFLIFSARYPRSSPKRTEPDFATYWRMSHTCKCVCKIWGPPKNWLPRNCLFWRVLRHVVTFQDETWYRLRQSENNTGNYAFSQKFMDLGPQMHKLDLHFYPPSTTTAFCFFATADLNVRQARQLSGLAYIPHADRRHRK